MLIYRSTFRSDLKALLTLKSERAEQRAAFFRDFDQTEDYAFDNWHAAQSPPRRPRVNISRCPKL
jgi:hypothetical protein